MYACFSYWKVWNLWGSGQVMRSEMLRLQHEQNAMKDKIRENAEKIKQNKVLPYLVGNVVEVSFYFLLSPLEKIITYLVMRARF